MSKYIIAMVKSPEYTGHAPRIKLLNTGRIYSRLAAIQRAEQMNSDCQEELKALDYDRFVSYSLETY